VEPSHGDFYLQQGCCVSCGVPQAVAPALVGWAMTRTRQTGIGLSNPETRTNSDKLSGSFTSKIWIVTDMPEQTGKS
jgi:hypothetical protein